MVSKSNSQPFIFKKQIVAILLCFVVMIVSVVLGVRILVRTSFFYALLIVGITAFPKLKSIFHYSDVTQTILFILPYYLPIIFMAIPKISLSFEKMIVFFYGFILILLLLFFERWELKKSLDSIKSKISITTSDFFSSLILTSLGILGEEFFFRVFLMDALSNLNEMPRIIAISLLFSLTHYLNRWANRNYKIKNYIIFFLLSLVLCVSYVESGRQWIICFFLHVFF